MHPLASASAPLDFAAVYREHHGFVWRTLRHLGVDPDRVDDALQDTFMVVHARLAGFEGRAALRTWLFEIARRVAARYRRTAAREAPRLCVLPEVAGPVPVDDSVELAEAAEILRVFLDDLDRDKSVVFIMAELEQWRVPEIAEALELNINTVYARLRAARKQLDRVVTRLQARDRRPRRAADVVALAVLAVPPPSSLAAPIGLAAPDLTAAPFVATTTVTGGATKLGLIAAGVALAAVVTTVAAAPQTRPNPTITAPTHAAPEPTPADREAPTPSDPLAAELALLEQARAALARDPAGALALLAAHARSFPTGVLAQEVAATRIEALCQHGDGAAARREAAAFARRWPASAAWVTAPCRR